MNAVSDALSRRARVELGEPLVRRLGVWFTHDGAALQSMTDVDADGLLVVELARVVR